MRILYITTVASTINAFLIPHIKMLNKNGNIIDIATSDTSLLKKEVYDFTENIYEISFERSPINKKNFNAYYSLRQLLDKKKYDVIHVHTPIAAFLTRMVIKKSDRIKIIYTAHGFHFFNGAPKKNWLLYYPAEKMLAKKTDLLITLNQEDYLKGSKLGAKNTIKMNGVGINLQKFSHKDSNDDLKRKLGIKEKEKIFLSVGELNKNKNHQLVIEALSKFDKLAFKYFICGKGPEKESLEELIKVNKLENKVFLLGFRNDILRLMQISDLFIFPSRREGLPVSIMEAMASGLPIIASNIRGNVDLVTNGKSGYLFDDNNVNDLISKINLFLSESENSIEQYSEYNKNKITDYSTDVILEYLSDIYSKLF